MKKMNKKETEELIKKLKPFWEKYRKLKEEHFEKLKVLENEMNKKVNVKTNLEFFYCDGECCGIGAEDYSDREWFPLIHDTELLK